MNNERLIGLDTDLQFNKIMLLCCPSGLIRKTDINS